MPSSSSLRPIRPASFTTQPGGWLPRTWTSSSTLRDGNYDNLDNGVATYGLSTYDTTPPVLGNEHSSYRYYPSPNATVDYAVTNGIVWVNAAGNQDEWTLRMKDDDYSLNLSRNSEYYGYVIFNPDEADADDQTCQEIDVRALSQNLYRPAVGGYRPTGRTPGGAHS